MNIKEAVEYMDVEKAIELEERRVFCNADETINAISTYSMEKQIPIKPKIMPKPLKSETFWWYCGKCGAAHHTNIRHNYCNYCGQRADWSDEISDKEIKRKSKKSFPELEVIKYMNNNKLKPCPFCGGKVHFEDISTPEETYFMIQCDNKQCSAAVCFGDLSETKEQATESWNRRTEK